tara:strand:- start:99 stop:512 length:414 start_codon:yes stop_codon:yes gene_type:complete
MMTKHYGKLGVKDLDNRVYKLWLSRDEELPLCEPVGWSWMYVIDPAKDDLVVHVILQSKLTNKEHMIVLACVFDGATLEEMAIQLNRTKERIRQILAKALRKMRWQHNLIEEIGYPFKNYKSLVTLVQERRDRELDQ